MKDTGSLEKKLGLSFKKQDLLKEAITHRSYLNENPKWSLPHNERLEYLGDAVLELAVTETLFKKFPTSPEGQLTVYRASLVNYQSLAMVAEEIGLGDYILMSRGEKLDNNKAKEVILANAIEAVIGAIYLDLGFESAEKFIEKHVLALLPEILKSKSYRDPKSELQEIVQDKFKVTPAYKVLEESGPAHKREFKVGVYFGKDNPEAEGSGASKQEAEVVAARNALEKYK
ncbi:MAG: ribonuclease III [Candidatus Liptonbacteria bacterium]|nr:ribonuclease III [Candidatus Liptonbacteria bacterium]